MSISVIIPVYNARKYLGQAIESVLAQSLKPLEIIVVDDGSTDNSVAVAQEFEPDITLLKLAENNGAGAARNLGINKASGRYLAFLDADDFWVRNKLEIQLDYLKKNMAMDMVFGKVEQFISPELPDTSRQQLKANLKEMPGFSAGTILIKKEAFANVGLFNEKLELGEFIDWFSRAKDMGLRFHMLDEIVLKRRIHDSNMGVYKQQYLKDYTSILRAALERKRAKDH